MAEQWFEFSDPTLSESDINRLVSNFRNRDDVACTDGLEDDLEMTAVAGSPARGWSKEIRRGSEPGTFEVRVEFVGDRPMPSAMAANVEHNFIDPRSGKSIGCTLTKLVALDADDGDDDGDLELDAEDADIELVPDHLAPPRQYEHLDVELRPIEHGLPDLGSLEDNGSHDLQPIEQLTAARAAEGRTMGHEYEIDEEEEDEEEEEEDEVEDEDLAAAILSKEGTNIVEQADALLLEIEPSAAALNWRDRSRIVTSMLKLSGLVDTAAAPVETPLDVSRVRGTPVASRRAIDSARVPLVATAGSGRATTTSGKHVVDLRGLRGANGVETRLGRCVTWLKAHRPGLSEDWEDQLIAAQELLRSAEVVE